MQKAVSRPTSRDSRKYHGIGGTSTYRSWYSMLDRCINPANGSWLNYGGRGVSVCEKWHDVETFVADMGLRPPGTTIDRIDGDKGYEPGNCRWATLLDQQRNRRGVKCSMELARNIRRRLSAGETRAGIARWCGLHPSVVSRIASNEIWQEAADAEPK